MNLNNFKRFLFIGAICTVILLSVETIASYGKVSYVKNYKINKNYSDTTICDIVDYRYKGVGKWRYSTFDRLVTYIGDEVSILFKIDEGAVYVSKVTNKGITLNNYEKSKYILALLSKATGRYYHSNEYLKYRNPEISTYTKLNEHLKYNEIDESYLFNKDLDKHAGYPLSDNGFNDIEKLQNSKYLNSRHNFIDISDLSNNYKSDDLFFNGRVLNVDIPSYKTVYEYEIFCDNITNKYYILSIVDKSNNERYSNETEMSEINNIILEINKFTR